MLAFCGVIAMFWAGFSYSAQRWLTDENKAKIRLRRAGYDLDPLSAFRAVERNDQMALERLHLIGINLDEFNAEGLTTLGFAAKEDRLEISKKLLELGVPLTKADQFGKTALSYALENEHLHVARLLFDKGGDPNEPIGSQQVPALSWAIKEGRNHLVDLLLDKGADINMDSAIGSPLYLAFEREDLALANRLLDEGADPNGTTPKGTPLIFAALHMDWTEMTERLLKEGIDINQEFTPGMTPGVLAMELDRPEVARALLEAGANPNYRGQGHNSILQMAFTKRDQDTMLVALDRGGNLAIPFDDGSTLLERAVTAEDRVWTERLLKFGANPNVSPGGEPLWWTLLQTGNRDYAEMLISSGANINALVSEGRRPLDLAIEDKDLRLARYLLEHGAISSGYLWHTLKDQDYAMMRFLLANGEDPNKLSPEGITPIGHCIMTGDVTAAALLMEYGAEIDTSEMPGGHTLLEWSIANKQLPIAERLLTVGINPNNYISQPVSDLFLEKFEDKTLRHYLVADSKVTPLMVVASTGQHQLAQALLKHGAKTGVYTSKYKTWPINFATRVDDVPMTQIILGKDPDAKAQKRKIIITLSEQRARLYEEGKVKLSTRVSTGKSGYSTPKGTFVITNKDRTRTSNLYDAEMPYFMRLSCSAIGMHQGYVPTYPASHGCIRLPEGFARQFFYTAEVGDIVVIQ